MFQFLYRNPQRRHRMFHLRVCRSVIISVSININFHTQLENEKQHNKGPESRHLLEASWAHSQLINNKLRFGKVRLPLINSSWHKFLSRDRSLFWHLYPCLLRLSKAQCLDHQIWWIHFPNSVRLLLPPVATPSVQTWSTIATANGKGPWEQRQYLHIGCNFHFFDDL